MGHSSGAGGGKGRITCGIELGTLVGQTMEFVRARLPDWRDDPDRQPQDSEEELNGQLCKYLNVTARHAFPMAHFHHEERQAKRRRVDLSVLPTEPMWVGTGHHSIYEPFLVLEGKRLPAPSRDREREYVTGLEKRTGGMQRFKLGLHGASLRTAAMIGYVQRGSTRDWHQTINGWIMDLAVRPGADICPWGKEDRLQELREDSQRAVATCHSSHPRTVTTHSESIALYHLWAVMNPNSQ